MPSDTGTDQWYVAVLVVRALVAGAPPADALVDHQVRLLRAPDAEAAYERALALGAAQRQAYRNADGQEVTWEFAGLFDLDVLADQALADGTEVYSWRLRGDAAEAVVPKERLSVFWLASLAGRTVGEVLG